MYLVSWAEGSSVREVRAGRWAGLGRWGVGSGLAHRPAWWRGRAGWAGGQRGAVAGRGRGVGWGGGACGGGGGGGGGGVHGVGWGGGDSHRLFTILDGGGSSVADQFL
ncbi:leucine-rich repeat extensin-like protein [Gracilaria domingensis]|nr:leucine-rich repeat extensin-like protein [Gracilaria domingensis]